MRKSSISLALFALAAIALLIPQSGLAQWEPAGDDVLGMYFGENHAVWDTVGTGTADPVSVILTNVTGASVGGFEFVLTYDQSALVMTDQGLQPGDVNFAAGVVGWFQVGQASPRSISTGNALLVEPTFFVISPEPSYIAVTHFPDDFATIPGAIVYAEFIDVSQVHQMYSASGNFEDPIFAFNEADYVETESQTWSDLKSLYR